MPRVGAHINILGECVDAALPEGHAVAPLAYRQRGEAFWHRVDDAPPERCIVILYTVASASRRRQSDHYTSELHADLLQRKCQA